MTVTTADTPNVEEMLDIARAQHPDLWERVDGVARIIDPAAFADGHVVHPDDTRSLFETRRRYMQAAATHKACEVLEYLGINTSTDWLHILSVLAERADEEDRP